MSERPLLGEQSWVVNRIEDGVELVGHVAGPAGSNALVLGDIEIDIDVASPRVVNRVAINDFGLFRDRRGRSLLVRLLGGYAVQEIVDLVGRGPAASRVAVQPSSRTDGRLDTRIAALAAATYAAVEPARTTEEQAIALQEALLLAHELDLLDVMEELVASAGRAASWLVAADHVELHTSDPSAAARAADVLSNCAELHPDFASGLRRVAALLALATTAPPPRTGEAPTDLRCSFSRDSLSYLVAGRNPSLTKVSEDEYEIRLPGWGRRVDDWWVRAFDAESAIAIAAVPMQAEGDDAVAAMLLPPIDLDRLTFDIVEDVTTRRSPAAVAAFKAAVATGRRASATERLGHLGRARELWRQTSALHEEAGDLTRANLANAIAHDELGGSRAIERASFEPLASDRLGPQND